MQQEVLTVGVDLAKNDFRSTLSMPMAKCWSGDSFGALRF